MGAAVTRVPRMPSGIGTSAVRLLRQAGRAIRPREIPAAG